MIDVALIGCGHMGTHHARIIAAHPGCRLVAAVDLRPDRAQALAARFGGRAIPSLPTQVDAVVVATPTTTHAQVAQGPLSRGQWCLVEKPVTGDLASLADLHGDRLVVGHSERFNPALRAAAAPTQGPVELVRRVAPSPRGRDVDVVLDLMIHDLDLLLWWTQGADWRILAREGTADDARVRLQVGGLTATLHASRNAERGERRITALDTGRTWDLLAGRAWQDGRPLPAPDGRDALTCQWEAFVGAVHGAPRAVTLREGAQALRLALQIRNELERSAA